MNGKMEMGNRRCEQEIYWREKEREMYSIYRLEICWKKKEKDGRYSADMGKRSAGKRKRGRYIVDIGRRSAEERKERKEKKQQSRVLSSKYSPITVLPISWYRIQVSRKARYPISEVSFAAGFWGDTSYDAREHLCQREG